MAWIRKRRQYSKPRKLFNKVRIEEENEIVKKYGLKSKREIWKAEAAINRIRGIAKKLITADTEQQEKLFAKLGKQGFKVSSTADVLALTSENWLKRRFQSILMEKKGVKPKQARQLITHKHVAIDGNIVNVPSYMVSVDEEDKIKIIKMKTPEMRTAKKKEEKIENE